MQKNTLTFENFFSLLRSKIRKILNLTLFFYIFFRQNSKISKIIIPVQKIFSTIRDSIKWRFLSFDSPICHFREKNNSFARRNLFIIQLIPPSCRFSLTFRGTRIIYVSSGHGPFFPFIERTLIKFLQFSRRTKGQFTRFSCFWPNGCN